MKVSINETITREVEVELPIYGQWEDDVNDGRVYWETWFCLDENLKYRSVTHWQGDADKWEIEIDNFGTYPLGTCMV